MKAIIVAPILLALALLLLPACGPQPALPTRAAPALFPPTPPVLPPTPTTAGATTTVNTPAPTSLPVAPVAEPPLATADAATPLPLPSGEAAAAVPTGVWPIASPTPCATPGRVEAGELASAVASQTMRYRIYLPPCYGEDGRVYPTLYLFGGNIHDETFWDRLGFDEAAEAAIVAGRIPPLLIVMPDNGWLANTTSSGPTSYEGFVLNELIPHIESQTCAWPAREGRAVGGVSRGGYWSLMMAFRRPDLFRSVGAHSPALIDSFAGPDEDPRVTGTANPLGDLRIWVDIGERDPYLTAARPLHDTLTAAGVAHEWRVNPGIHDEAYWTAHLDDYITWYAAGFPADRAALPGC